MKIFAFYLPQFHAIKENDDWWGEGFTDWVNVKSAKNLVRGQNQPNTPLNSNYYDLLDKNTFKEQVRLANDYKINGFCFYHYWFNGKLLLEKPLENFLKDKSLDLEFCLSWANEPWTRAWDGQEKNVLMPQEYGDKKDWKNHYDYLRPFFLDKRYLKINNKPVLVIYRSNSIDSLNEMLNFFNVEAKKDGFLGLFFTQTLNSFQTKEERFNFDASIEFEPVYTLQHKLPKWFYLKKKLAFRIYNLFKGILPDIWKINKIAYSLVWNSIIKRPVEKNVFLGAFPAWDNSPRKKYNSTIVVDSSPKKFEKFLSLQIDRAIKAEVPMIFINAWNEWAEGAYLEPDEKNKFANLESVSKALKSNNL